MCCHGLDKRFRLTERRVDPHLGYPAEKLFKPRPLVAEAERHVDDGYTLARPLDGYAVGLTPGERTAVLACLEDPPDGLAELRGVLMCEHAG